jgi:hypothetical protein
MHITHGITFTPELADKLNATYCSKDIAYGEVYQSVIYKHNKSDADILINLIVTYNHPARRMHVFYSMDTTTGARVHYSGISISTQGFTTQPKITDSFWPREDSASAGFLNLFNNPYLRHTLNAAIEDILGRYSYDGSLDLLPESLK